MEQNSAAYRTGARRLTLNQEREFLSLAGTYLACRFVAMGHDIEGNTHPTDLSFQMLGMLDYRNEMKLLVVGYFEKLTPA